MEQKLSGSAPAAAAAEHPSPAVAFAASAAGSSAASSAEFRQTFSAHSKAITTLCFSPDATMLATIGQDAALRVWAVEQPQQPEKQQQANHPRWLHQSNFQGCAVCFSGDSR